MAEVILEALKFVRDNIGCGDLESVCYVFAVKLSELDNERGLYDARVWCLVNRDLLFDYKGGVWCPKI